MTGTLPGLSETTPKAQAPEKKAAKSSAAFRTITEVARELDLPQHVLRFWESKFSQVRPMKRGGGRRYYRPEDVELLKRIRDLLHAEGYTIKGVQKLLRQGQSAVAAADADTDHATALPDSGLTGVQRVEIRAVLRDLEAMRDELQKVL